MLPEISDSRKIGTFILFLGVFFLLLGMLLLFDRKLLSLGNLLFISGFILLSGIQSTLKFFGLFVGEWQNRWKSKWRGLGTFILGILMVLLTKWTIFGIFVELFGFINIFGAFFPIALAFLRRLPIVGPLLNAPIIGIIADKIAGKNSSSIV